MGLLYALFPHNVHIVAGQAKGFVWESRDIEREKERETSTSVCECEKKKTVAIGGGIRVTLRLYS